MTKLERTVVRLNHTSVQGESSASCSLFYRYLVFNLHYDDYSLAKPLCIICIRNDFLDEFIHR